MLRPALALIFCCSIISAHAQLDALFQPFDCREHAELFHEEPVADQVLAPEVIQPVAMVEETPIVIDTVNGWKLWTSVENFTYGKDRGAMTMITDLNALHPYFRDRIAALIATCKKNGIELAIVETYRTHAKQNEYKTMGKKYTNSGGGRSKHQYGLAIDVVPIVDSVAVWDNVALWRKVGVTGEKLGLRWGGRWRKPYDPGHFEWTGGLTAAHLGTGLLPTVPVDQYPCIDDDLRILRKYWKEWEVSQSALTRR